MKIAVDAMGGDYGVSTVVEGAVEAAKKYQIQAILVGDEKLISKELKKYPKYADFFEIRHTDVFITMEDKPSVALKEKRKSSINVGLGLVKNKEVGGFYSAGNTGAIMAGALIQLRKIPGIERPAIGAILPKSTGKTLLLDVGANVDCKPFHLVQFAIMGAAYYKSLFKVEEPGVSLLNNGEEEQKGTELVKTTYGYLQDMALHGLINFQGNVEAKDFYNVGADVVVADGFTGNIALKITESVGSFVARTFIKKIIYNPLAWIGSIFMLPTLLGFRKVVDYHQYGGAPLLGVNGVCVIGHGSASVKSISRGIKYCTDLANSKLLDDITASIAESTNYLSAVNTASSIGRI